MVNYHYWKEGGHVGLRSAGQCSATPDTRGLDAAIVVRYKAKIWKRIAAILT